MTASVITKLSPIIEDAVWGATPYALEIKGKAERRVTITELMDPDGGRKTVRIIALAAAGVPVLPLSTLDQIARNILPNARVQSPSKGDTRHIREYATA